MAHPLKAFAVLGKAVWRVFTMPIRHWRVIAIFAIVLVIAYIVVDNILLHKLAVQREEIRAAGGAVSFEDLNIPMLGNYENAAVAYRYASGLLNKVHSEFFGWDQNSSSSADKENRPPRGMHTERFDLQMTPPRQRKVLEPGSREAELMAPLNEAELAELAEMMDQVRPGMQIVREARDRKGCVLGNYESPQAFVADPGSLLGELAFMRSLARHARYMANWECHQGNTEEALEWVTTGLHLANDMTYDATLMVGMVRCAVASNALYALRNVLYEADLPAHIPEELPKELDKLADRRFFERVYEGERCFASAVAKFQGTQMGPIRRIGYTFMMTPVMLSMNNYASVFIQACKENDPAKRKAVLAPLQDALDQYEANNKRTFRVVNWLQFGDFEACALPAHRGLLDGMNRQAAMAQGARLALALKMHKRDKGFYPDALGAIVPEYVDQLPLDPFSGEDYLYRLQDDGFLLYSIGENEKDDGGAPLVRSQGRVISGDILWCAAK